MKKILALALCLCMVICAVACTTKEPEAKEAEYKLGLGVVVSTASSKENNAQVDATIAAVVTDAEGKIVACRIDVAQNKMDITNGAVDTAKTFETKMELGDRYGMAGKVDNNGDGVMKEWYEQTKAFETYVTGKTVAEVEAIKTQEANGHQIAVDEALLNAGCSMQITDFIQAVAKACKDEQGMSFKTAATFTLGVAAKTAAADSKAATAEADGLVAMYSDIAACVVADGKIIAALNDAIQPKINVTVAGVPTAQEFKGTKRELKSDYGMEGKVDNNGDGVMKEWFEQSKAFSEYAVGKTAADIKGMQTTEANGHQITVDQALLDAGCSIQITGICAVVAQAAENAR